MRAVLKSAIDLGIPMPAFMSALAYFDAYRSETLPTNLIQAQRDYFGAHTYERVDQEGIFHTQWN
jgi:6-phosphogluconate dehydrogenase